jgi:dTDP-4-amino-4,6-dideoxygalactose transaminase
MLLVGEPCLGEAEKAALAQVIDSNWITMGERVRAFELAFAAEHGAPDAAAVNSCTAGLHLVLAALGLGPGDEVLVPSLSFVATANCALYVGATPVFVDIAGLDEPIMSLEDAGLKCSRRTKAVIIMHYAGYLADRDAWRHFAQSRGIWLIEDAAHAAGAAGAGCFGDAAVFSFYGNKNMTTAEGGMVIARDPEVLERVKQMRSHGMTSGARQRLDARTPTYDVTMLGWNYRMDELRAAVGLVQLRSLRCWNERRRELVRTYRDALAERCPDVRAPFANTHRPSAYHFFPAVLPDDADRQLVMSRMRDAGVQTTVHYPPIHCLFFYRERYPSVCLPRTERFAKRELTLPLHQQLEYGDVETVANALATALYNWEVGSCRRR